jgi:hypothetical protein
MNEPKGAEGVDRPPLAALRDFVRRRGPLERCELCGNGLHAQHPHLLGPDRRQVLCSCEPCAVLFAEGRATGYKRIPRRISLLADFDLSDRQWDALMIPIDLAFFLYSSPANQMVAVYPGPAGATESTLRLDAWDGIARGHPRLRDLEPDVEALLVNRVRHHGEGSKPRYFVVPIDECYRLVGLIRQSWHGLSGGGAVWNDIEKFFADLELRADREVAPSHA